MELSRSHLRKDNVNEVRYLGGYETDQGVEKNDDHGHEDDFTFAQGIDASTGFRATVDLGVDIRVDSGVKGPVLSSINSCCCCNCDCGCDYDTPAAACGTLLGVERSGRGAEAQGRIGGG